MMPLVLITLYKRENSWYSTSHESLSHFMYVLVSLFSWSTPSYICFFWWMQGHYFYETLWNKPEYIHVLLFLPPYPPLPYIPYIYVSLITLGAKRGYLFETRSRAASWASPSIRNLHQGQDGQSQNSTQYLVHNCTIFLCSLDVRNIDDQCRGPNIKEKDHLDG